MNKTLDIVLFTHYSLPARYSMPRFANLIMEGMTNRGHHVDLWSPPLIFGHLGKYFPFLQKWLGYIDQFLIFPFIVRRRLKKLKTNSLLVFCDQALGPWVPLVKNHPHIIHCHDFLALRGALGELTQHQPSYTGKLYQQFIRWGFSQGNCFISVSSATQNDLHRFLPVPAQLSTVVHNALNSPFEPIPYEQIMLMLIDLLPYTHKQPFILHIGNNWYKNRLGVLQIFEQLAETMPDLNLVMVSNPTRELKAWLHNRPSLIERIKFYQDISFKQLQALYSMAQALVFPSLFEGFGWPILEALACGCPVLTTKAQPMTEVGGDAAFYISLYPCSPVEQISWAKQAAEKLKSIFALAPEHKEFLKRKGLAHASHFSIEQSMSSYEQYYYEALNIGVGCE